MAITLVQNAAAVSDAVAFGSANTAGNFLVAMVQTSSTISGVSDPTNGAWTKAVELDNGGTLMSTAIWYLPNCAGGVAPTVTAANGFGGSFCHIAIAEYSGIATSSPLDQTQGFDTSGSQSGTPSSGLTPTTSQASELLIGVISNQSALTISWDAGWTKEYEDTSAGAGRAMTWADQTVSSTGTYKASGTISPAVTGWQAVIATFVTAGGGGGTNVTVPVSVCTAAWAAPSVTVSAGASVSVSVGTAAWSDPSVSVSAGANVAAGVPTAAWGEPIPAVSGAANVSVAVGTAAWSEPAPAVAAGATVAAGVPTASWSAPNATVVTPDANVLVSAASAVWAAPPASGPGSPPPAFPPPPFVPPPFAVTGPTVVDEDTLEAVRILWVEAADLPPVPVVDEDTLEAVRLLWEADAVQLPQLFDRPPQAGRLKSPQPALYAVLDCKLDSRRKIGTGAASGWYDYRLFTITVYGQKAPVVQALAAIQAVFNNETQLAYPSASQAPTRNRFMRWEPVGDAELTEDPDTKQGQDWWRGVLKARVQSVRAV